MPRTRAIVVLSFLLAGAACRASLCQEDPRTLLERELAKRYDEAAPALDGGVIAAAAVHGVVEGAGAGFYIRGRSTLPVRAVLQVTLHFQGRGVTGRKTTVEADGAFRCLLGPFPGKRVVDGLYAVSVLYEAHRQPESVREVEGVPVEPLEVATEVRVGTVEGEAVELEARKKAFLEMLAALDELETELGTEFVAAKEKTKYTVGEAKDFDEGEWRKWVADWRGRLGSRVSERLRLYRDEEVLAVPLLAAHQTGTGLAYWYLELHRALCRELYLDLGRPLAAEDRIPEGGALVSPGTIRGHIKDHRAELARLLGLEKCEEENR